MNAIKRLAVPLTPGESADALRRGFILDVIATASLWVTTKSMAAPFCIPQAADPAERLRTNRGYPGKNHEPRHFPAA
jgi:hypothetical protein